MDLRRLRHFSILAEALNVSRAAERLHIAQPALSVSIQKLEAELGVRLFDRTPTGVILTASGRAALLEARRVLYHGEQLLRATRETAVGTAGQLRIGFVGSAIFRLIPTLIPSFRASFPGVQLVLRESTSARIMEMLNEEALDMGIVRSPLLQTHAATLHTIQRDRFVVALPAAHPLSACESLCLAELAREPFVMYSAASAGALHTFALAACEAAGFVPEVAQEATQVPTVLALVESGLGIALVPEIMRGWREPQVTYRDLQDTGTSTVTALALAWIDDNTPPAAQRFVEHTRRFRAT